MKVTIRYCLSWGNITTQALEIEPTAVLDELLDIIAQKFNVPKSEQVLKIKEDGIPLLLIPDWPISKYNIQDDSIIFLEHSTALEVVDINKSDIQDMTNQIDSLSAVDVDAEPEDTEQYQKPASMKKLGGVATNFTGEVLSDEWPGSNEDSFEKKTGNQSASQNLNKIMEQRERLIQEVRANHIGEVLFMLKYIEDTEDDKEDLSSASSISLVKKIIDGRGQVGWNALQWAVHSGHAEITQELLNFGADVNIQTEDGWTVLQLAIYRNHLDVAKILVNTPGVNINEVTEKGTALHIAVRTDKPEFVALLLSHGANIRLKDKQGVLPYEIASHDGIKQLIEKKASETFCPPKPPLVKGYMFKKGSYLLMMNKRYFVMNPNDGTLGRYKKREDYPSKPREIIDLKEVSLVRRMKPGVLYDKQYAYFQILCRRREILACLNEDIANQWVTFLVQGAVYAAYLESKKQEVAEIEPGTQEKANENSVSQATEELELNDIPYNKTKAQTSTIKPLAKEELKVDNTDMDTSQMLNNLERLDEDDEPVNFESFEILKSIGVGAFGTVYKVKKKNTGRIYAMKALQKRKLILKNHLRYAITESNVLKTANHPFVIGLHYAFQTPKYLYLILEYCPGSDLASHLHQKKTFAEDEVRFYLAELILAVEYLHSLNIIYRDLKPENILLDETGHIKLADFGLSKEGIGDEDFARSFCGSPAYLSPEILEKRAVGKPADIYGIGTVMYELLTGKSPFYSDDIPSMYHNIKKAKLQIPKGISDKAKNLLTKLLSRDPTKRPTFKGKADMKKDPFFQGIDWEKLKRKQIAPPKLDTRSHEDDDIEVPISNIVFQDLDYSESNKLVNRVKNFSFVRKGTS